ncbi:hypothetical protein ACIQFZ_24665 [Streptomyces sp. NPDC093064]|uniref:hypothetical protein n=1 Tax=unclassified Streptomyces TaxID=2593676 RepID=UPI003412183D
MRVTHGDIAAPGVIVQFAMPNSAMTQESCSFNWARRRPFASTEAWTPSETAGSTRASV